MNIKTELIPKDKIEEITSKQIVKIVDSLYEPLKVSISENELPKFQNSYNEIEYKNREFRNRLISVKNGKALFEPKANDWKSIKIFDSVKAIEKQLFKLKMKQAELRKIDTKNRDQKRQNVILLFDKIFYKRTLNKRPQPKKQIFSLECDYSANEIKSKLLPLFQQFFECTEIEVINLLSENITTQITAKKEFTGKDIIYFINWLKENNHIKASQYGNVIDKTKCIIYDNKPLTSLKIRKTKYTFKNSLPSLKISKILNIAN